MISSTSPHSVMRSIPQGKPSKETGGVAKDYKGMKGDGNCHLYALKLATGFQAELTPNSKANIKKHRQKITELDDIWWKRQTVINVIQLSFQYIGGSFQDKSNILHHVESILKILTQNETTKKIRSGTCAAARDFFAKYRTSSVVNVLDFQKELQKEERVSNHNQFLLSEKIPLGEKFATLKREYGKILPIDLTSLGGRYHVLHNVFTDHLNEQFKMEHCEWTPTQPLDVLANIIREKGPVVVGAILGAEHAVRPAHILEDVSVDEYAVVGWNEDTYEQKADVSGHSILLVGVVNGYVIFVDPQVPCRADEKRKAYAIPYSIFCNKVISILGYNMPADKTTKYPQQHYLLAPKPVLKE